MPKFTVRMFTVDWEWEGVEAEDSEKAIERAQALLDKGPPGLVPMGEPVLWQAYEEEDRRPPKVTIDGSLILVEPPEEEADE